MKRGWKCRNTSFICGEKTLIMGVLNVTPDSFSDGASYYDTEDAIHRAYEIIDEGADILDIGGESSRPGAEPVSEEEELRRVIPVIEEVFPESSIVISVDTVKYDVAKQALEAGASIVNDISGLQRDPRLAELCAEWEAGYVLMHMRGTPQTMQEMTNYVDIVTEIREYFERQIDLALNLGVKEEQIVLDPGIGFGKTPEQNLSILQHLDKIRWYGFPLLVGVSRKSFIGKVTGREAHNRLMGSAGAVAASVLRGADIVRVHDIIAMRDVVRVVDAIKTESIF